MANYNITLNGATVGQTYTYTATANGTDIGSGSIVATAANNTYSASSISWGVAATNTVASWNIVLSVTNNGTTKTSSTTTTAATYTAPVNITSVEFNAAPTTVQPYGTLTFYVAINGVPSSLGNVKVQIEGWNGNTWIDLDATYYLKDATVTSIVAGNPSRRYIEFTITHSNPGTTDFIIPVRARAYQESNPSNLARSGQIDVTLKGVSPSYDLSLGDIAITGQSTNYTNGSGPQWYQTPIDVYIGDGAPNSTVYLRIPSATFIFWAGNTYLDMNAGVPIVLNSIGRWNDIMTVQTTSNNSTYSIYWELVYNNSIVDSGVFYPDYNGGAGG
jgi:hypothetical protein